MHFQVWPFIWTFVISFFFSYSLAECFCFIYLFTKETMNKTKEMMSNMRRIKKTMNNRRSTKIMSNK